MARHVRRSGGDPVRRGGNKKMPGIIRGRNDCLRAVAKRTAFELLGGILFITYNLNSFKGARRSRSVGRSARRITSERIC